MKKIEIKNRFTNKVIYTYESETANIKDAVEQAVKDGTSLYGASLDGASLNHASLDHASLDHASLNHASIVGAYLPIFCKWSYSIIDEKIKIGCETRTIEDWDIFFASDEIITTERNTDEFKQIQAVYFACKAYLTHLKS